MNCRIEHMTINFNTAVAQICFQVIICNTFRYFGQGISVKTLQALTNSYDIRVTVRNFEETK
jgi:predicted small secreted protein